MVHERFELEGWIKRTPLKGLKNEENVGFLPVGPVGVAYVEQIRRRLLRRGVDLGRPCPADVCVWKLGEPPRRDVTKVGGVPYWPAKEPWPVLPNGQPRTFFAQFCFADSKDLVPDLPADVLVILNGDGFADFSFHWFEPGCKQLLSPKRVPRPENPLTPCHAVLHRTTEYPDADYELFEEYPYPVSLFARVFRDGAKIGGHWWERGEYPDPDEFDDLKTRWEVRAARRRSHLSRFAFIAQLGSIRGQPGRAFLPADELARTTELMVGDMGGFDFFDDGHRTTAGWWSG